MENHPRQHRPRTILRFGQVQWCRSGPDFLEPDRWSGSNHGSGPDHGSTRCTSIATFFL
ncbi:hypothetical protein BDR03DRAFT_967290 [Suillus americanus]|nr:hypothetical protein BDR03DRAFT_967290 [Suillus americanus]